MGVDQPRPEQVLALVRRLRGAVEGDLVRVEEYALERATAELGWDETSILLELMRIEAHHFLRTERAGDPLFRGETIWVFTPPVQIPPTFGDVSLWIRLIERNGVVVVSFHEA